MGIAGVGVVNIFSKLSFRKIRDQSMGRQVCLTMPALALL